MAKFQLCEFRRVAHPTAMLKADPKNKWERGLACVSDFGGDVDYIIDDEGNKLKREPHSFRLLAGYGSVSIDTEEPSVFYPR